MPRLDYAVVDTNQPQKDILPHYPCQTKDCTLVGNFHHFLSKIWLQIQLVMMIISQILVWSGINISLRHGKARCSPPLPPPPPPLLRFDGKNAATLIAFLWHRTTKKQHFYLTWSKYARGSLTGTDCPDTSWMTTANIYQTGITSIPEPQCFVSWGCHNLVIPLRHRKLRLTDHKE